MNNTFKAAALLGGIAFTSFAQQAKASLTLRYTQVGDDLVVSLDGGTLDTTGLSVSAPQNESNFDNTVHVQAGHLGNLFGFATEQTYQMVSYSNGTSSISVTQSANWTQITDTFDSASCIFARVEGNVRGANSAVNGTGLVFANSDTGSIFLDSNTVIGLNQVDGFEITIFNRGLDDFNLTDGSNMTFDWGTDSITIQANSVVAVPEPSSAALLGLGGVALLMRRRK